ncbi:MAG: 2,3-diketo-5-methylthio-1-phosphopentane phosphatase, partial [Dehalococcoidales bacterium]|nr:2,3-diketo-5-methylthio-1-phosphopentane phosphatase [Dehalococcoidales bacterium]
EIYAAESHFYPGGKNVRYVGPDGKELEDGFKEVYTENLKRQGFDIIFAGNGISDIFSARLARYVFATEDLLECCREENLPCYPFTDFTDILVTMKTLNMD